MIERRKTVRSRTLLGGVIAFNRRKSSMDCEIRNFSPAGARVHFTNTAVVPDVFDLQIARKQRAYRARMAWRGVDEAGVEFLGEQVEATTVPLDWARRLRESESKNAALKRRVEQLTEGSA
jgi:PilZ domain